jgi:hypothetical protein
MSRHDVDDPYHWEDVYDDGNMPSRIVRVLHSRWLDGPGTPFEPMPEWVDAIRDRAKCAPSQRFSITMDEVRRLANEYPGHFSLYATIRTQWVTDWPDRQCRACGHGDSVHTGWPSPNGCLGCPCPGWLE